MQILAGKLTILIVADQSRRYGMVLAYAMVFLSLKPSNTNAIVWAKKYILKALVSAYEAQE